MGWGYAGLSEGRQIGYEILSTCDTRGCDEVVDHGLGYICGDMHHDLFSDEAGCGGYFCEKHHGYTTRGGLCSHRRRHATFPKRWGQTLCQLLIRDGRWETYPRILFCACMGWESDIQVEMFDDGQYLLDNWYLIPEFMHHALERDFHVDYLMMEIPDPVEANPCPNCGGDAGNNYFDRSLCACDVMHTRCRECGFALDICPLDALEEIAVEQG